MMLIFYEIVGFYLKMSTATEVSSEASEIQNEVLSTLLPFTVLWRARISLGATYTMSPCCRLNTGEDVSDWALQRSMV